MTRSLPSSFAEGNQRPTSEVIPAYFGNDCLDTIELMRSAGIELMDWQAYLLEAWMGYGKDGKWTAKTCGSEVPRQNGKTLAIQSRAWGETLLYGGTVIYTSQLQKTSTETFNEMAQLAENSALRKFIAPKGIRTALGREEIRLKNGARIKFLARTRAGGDGQHGSLLIFDEAQALDRAAQESFMPAISATRAERGPQTIYNGTPPKDGDFGLIFEKLRNDALNGKTSNVAYTEWSAGYGGRPPATDDRAAWERTNPAYGIIIDASAIEAEAEALDAEQFARQRLGWWTGQRSAQTLISESEWAALEAKAPMDEDKRAHGVRFSSDGALVALSVCVMVDGWAHVEFVRQEPTSKGIRWLVDWLAERSDVTALTAIDGRSAAEDLRLQLIDRGVSPQAVKVADTAFAASAAAAMVNGVADGTVTHCKSEALDRSATKSVKRKIGSSGGYGFAGEEPEIIESACLALLAARTTKRDPKRKAVVW